MGVGMQVACLGFAGAAGMEAEAGAQLVRIERFSRRISDCRLTVEAMRGANGLTYDARLDLITRLGDCVSLPRCVSEDAQTAVRSAFDAAEFELELREARADN